MSTKHIDTAADLVRFGASLKIECRECGSARTVSGAEAVRMLGALDELRTIRKRLRCSRCGAKAAALTILPPL